MHPVVSVLLPITAKETMCVFALSAYQNPIKSLILAKGWSNILASRQLARLIWQETVLKEQEFDFIVPVPLHWTRYAYRGYNQAEVIAQQLATFSGKPVVNLFARHKRTRFQSLFDKNNRAKNVANVFSYRIKERALYEDKHILLVDDLMTTGSTLKEMGNMLLELKPKTLKAIVAART